MSSNVKALRCRTLKCSILPRSSVSGSGSQQRQIRIFTDGSGGLGSRTGCARMVSSDHHHSTPSSHLKHRGVGNQKKRIHLPPSVRTSNEPSFEQKNRHFWRRCLISWKLALWRLDQWYRRNIWTTCWALLKLCWKSLLYLQGESLLWTADETPLRVWQIQLHNSKFKKWEHFAMVFSPLRSLSFTVQLVHLDTCAGCFFPEEAEQKLTLSWYKLSPGTG